MFTRPKRDLPFFFYVETRSLKPRTLYMILSRGIPYSTQLLWRSVLRCALLTVVQALPHLHRTNLLSSMYSSRFNLAVLNSLVRAFYSPRSRLITRCRWKTPSPTWQVGLHYSLSGAVSRAVYD